MTRQQPEGRKEPQSVEPRRRNQLQQSENWFSLSPFGLMRRFADDMDRMFEGFGIPGTMSRSGHWSESAQYMPEIDLFERDGKLVVRADLPGMTKDDVHVDITNNTIRIEGERKYEHESNEGGIFRSERSYGKFCRDLPIPEGVKTENATAVFKDGVLEVTLDAPEMTTNRRRIQIQDQSGVKPGKSAA